MPSGGVEEMVVVTRVRGAFSARVTMARLWADGVRCEARGSLDGPYPALGEVEILVPRSDLADAIEILEATEALDGGGTGEWANGEDEAEGSSGLILLGALAAAALAIVVALVLTLH